MRRPGFSNKIKYEESCRKTSFEWIIFASVQQWLPLSGGCHVAKQITAAAAAMERIAEKSNWFSHIVPRE